VKNAAKYAGPGFELVSYDPKTSISMVGNEAFQSDATVRDAAALAAADSAAMNQDACVASRFHYVEGNVDDADRYCEILAQELGRDRQWSDGTATSTPTDIRREVDVLAHLPGYRVWGGFDGSGLVIRSEDPVDFHPLGKTVNVVPVKSLRDATGAATVATQTVGVYPSARKVELRDSLAAAGVQRVVTLGGAAAAATSGHGLPHDGSLPLQRLVRWVSDEGSHAEHAETK
jgi:hypothetical protein